MGKIPENIIRSFLQRECVFFIGSGMSIEAGLPSSQDLSSSIIQQGNLIVNQKEKSLAEISEMFVNQHSRRELLEIIRDELAQKVASSSPITYKKFSELKPAPRYIITTNYDRLLENSIGSSSYVPIINEKQVSMVNTSKINLIKIHGDMDYIVDAVVTQNDFDTYEEKHPEMCSLLKTIFQSHVVVFIGFSLNDDNIRDMYSTVTQHLMEFMPDAYIVGPKASEGNYDGLNITPIDIEARTFIDELKKVVESELNTMPISVPQAPNSNPFSIYSTEYFSDNNKEEMLNQTFIEPINFSKITEWGNTVLEGHRGSGKSMILKYLSYEAQRKRKFSDSWDKHNLGFYLKLRPSVPNTSTELFFKGTHEEWKLYFSTFFNLMIGEEIIRCIISLKEDQGLSEKEETCFVQRLHYLFFSSIPKFHDDNNLENLEMVMQKARNDMSNLHQSSFVLPTDFLEQLKNLIEKCIESWRGKNFFILLDEYESLNDDQQKIVNNLIKNRSFSYKIGVKLCGMIYDSIDGTILELNHDYTYVNTDRCDGGMVDSQESNFKEFAIKVANRRLQTYGFDSTIQELLPKEEILDRLGFENGDYSGLDNIITMSSSIIREFLELCKDMVYYTNPEIINVRKEKLDVIPPHIQNTVIIIHSNILYENINIVTGFDEESKRSRNRNAKILIDNLARVFRNILKGSQSVEKRTVIGFLIKRPDSLKQSTREAINDCVAERLLEVPLDPREPQNPSRHVQLKRYRMARLLCPRFRLALADRWPKELDGNELNELLLRPESAVAELTQYFIKNIPVKQSTSLYDFDEGRE